MSLAKRFDIFARAREGVAAVEFAMLLPMLALVYLAAVEITELLLVDRQVENIASSVADIVARDTSISAAELTDLEDALPELIAPKTVTGLQVRVSSIRIVSSSEARVVWSHGYFDMDELEEGATVSDLPSQITSNPNIPSIVRADASYTYSPVLGSFRITEDRGLHKEDKVYTLRHSDYRRPRLVDPLTRS